MKILLDAHVSPAVAKQLRAREIDAIALNEWESGTYRTASDEELLTAALNNRRVLVTFDLRTIPQYLKQLAESGQHHADVILVDRGTIRMNDIGKLCRALASLCIHSGADEWKDRVVFLKDTGKDFGG